MISKDLRIEIRPLPNRSEIKKFSEELEYFSQPKSLPCLVNPETLKYESGLSSKDIEYLKEINFPYDISDVWQKGVAHPFWESSMMKVELKNTPTFLYPGKNPIDFVKYKFLLKSSYIYSSEEEIETGKKSEATHYIYNETIENDLKAVTIEKRNAIVGKISGLSLKKKKDLSMIILDEDMENQSDNYLTVKFEEIMNNEEQLAELERLLSKSTEEVSLSASIKIAIKKNVLKKTNKGIFFFDTNLGFSEQEVMEFLSEPENQDISLNIFSKIQ